MHFHRWTKWSEPKHWRTNKGTIMTTQSRRCTRCNLTDEKVVG